MAAFPGVEVIEGREGDYPFRASLPEEDVVRAVVDRIRAIDYGNFKDSIEDRDLSAFVHQVWYDGLRLQKKNE